MFINSILGLIIVLLLILILKLDREQFTQGYGTVFGPSPIPPQWSPESGRIPGHPVRNAVYSNMCEPVNYDAYCRRLEPGYGLLKDKIKLKGSCYRGFNNY